MTTTTFDRARHDWSTNADVNFILQQGFEAPERAQAPRFASALLFQAKLIGLIAVAGALSRSPAVFAALAALLWWSALLPRLNPFDFAYNRTLGRRAGAPKLTPAPAPRRFSQVEAATISTAAAVTMAAGAWVAATVFQAILLLAVAALIFARFCFGSFTYHVLRGHARFALDTLPWKRGA
jgi:Domain of unknown function (DUF4395)